MISTLQINKYKSKLTFTIPLIAITGLATLGIFAINQDVDPSASASNNSALTGTISYGESYITISNSSVIDLGNTEVTADSSYVYATDNVTVSTNVSTGYELYLSSANKEDASLTTPSSYTTIPTTSGTGGDNGTPAVLDRNTYGYAVPSGLIGNTKFDVSYASPSSSSKWAGVPAGSSDRIRSSGSAVTSGETTDVHYAAHVTNALAPGQYTGQVTYSAVVTPPDNDVEMTVSPNNGEPSGGTILTVTSGPTTIDTTSQLDTSEVEIYFRKDGITKGICAVTDVSVNTGKLVTICTTPSLARGEYYDVVTTVPRYGFTDHIPNGYLSGAIALDTVMQSSNIVDICAGLKETTSASDVYTYEVTDTRNSQKYFIRKFTFGDTPFCIMVENLYLPGDTVLSNDNSNIATTSYTLPASSTSFSSNSAIMNNGERYRNSGSGNNDGSFYNFCAVRAGNNCTVQYLSNAYDICPKYWRASQYENNNIIQRMNSIGMNLFFASMGGGVVNAPILTGYYGGSTIYNSEVETFWYSHSTPNSSGVWGISAGTTSLKSKNTQRSYGISVRCLVQAAS